jgi:hypothetical protein
MRVYNRIVGDIPDVEVPLAIGWKFVQYPAVSVDEIELEKQLELSKEELHKPTSTVHYPAGIDSSPFDDNEEECTAVKTWKPASRGVDLRSSSKYLEPLTLTERRQVLMAAGLSLREINQQERRRRVQIIMEWAYRKSPTDFTPCTAPNSETLLRRYLR